MSETCLSALGALDVGTIQTAAMRVRGRMVERPQIEALQVSSHPRES
jgi:hypothetical protein